MKKILNSVLTVILSVLIVSGFAYAAGSLTAPSGTPVNTSYTLTDLYNLASGTTASSPSGALPSTPGSVSLTFSSIDDVYTAISGEIANLDSAGLATGTQAFGITGQMYGDTDPSKVLTTANFPGTAVPGYTYPSSPIKTGVNICHNSGGSVVSCAGTGQDGQYQSGVVKSYTDNGDGTVTDNKTGLMWTKCSDGLSGASCATGTATTTSWYTAITQCEASTVGSHSDWRLPNATELFTLVEFNGNPAIASSTFPATSGSPYWTSTYNTAANPFLAMAVDFSYGRASELSKSSLYRNRCVR